MGSATELDDTGMISAKYAIVFVFGLGILAALASWWYTASLQRQPLALWGTDHALLIVRAPHVEALELKPVQGSSSTDQVLEIAGVPWQIVKTKNITGAGGLMNTRNAFINRHSFDWSEKVDVAHADWRYALRFRDNEKHATIAIAPATHTAILVETGAAVSVQPAIKAIEGFVQERLTIDKT